MLQWITINSDSVISCIPFGFYQLWRVLYKPQLFARFTSRECQSGSIHNTDASISLHIHPPSLWKSCWSRHVTQSGGKVLLSQVNSRSHFLKAYRLLNFKWLLILSEKSLKYRNHCHVQQSIQTVPHIFLIFYLWTNWNLY